jgi:hypothetical protein
MLERGAALTLDDPPDRPEPRRAEPERQQPDSPMSLMKRINCSNA